MGRNHSSMVIFMLLLMFLLSAAEMMLGVEARTCKGKSRGYVGLCFNDRNCGYICNSEGFVDGHCTWFRHICMCEGCKEGGYPPSPPGGRDPPPGSGDYPPSPPGGSEPSPGSGDYPPAPPGHGGGDYNHPPVTPPLT